MTINVEGLLYTVTIKLATIKYDLTEISQYTLCSDNKLCQFILCYNCKTSQLIITITIKRSSLMNG